MKDYIIYNDNTKFKFLVKNGTRESSIFICIYFNKHITKLEKKLTIFPKQKSTKLLQIFALEKMAPEIDV